MPLDATQLPKRSHQRKPTPVEATPPAPAKRSHARKPAAVATPNDTNAAARAELPGTLDALLARAKTAKDKAAVTYWAASRGSGLTEAWREMAKKAAIATGVFPDYAANPLPVGTVATVYSSPLVTIGLKVTPQASRLDADACFAYLAEAGVAKALLKRARKRFTTDFNGAHILTALLLA